MEEQKKDPIIRTFNPDSIPLTVEKLRELSGNHDLSDEEAESILRSVRKLAKILFLFSSMKPGNKVQFNNITEEHQKKAA